MIRLKLYPPSGTIKDARSLKFEISGIHTDLFRINMENVTHGTKIVVNSLQNMGGGLYMGIMDVKIPDHLFHSAISIFAHVEEQQKDGTYKTVQICPTIFTVKNDTSVVLERLSVSPSFVGPEDLCSIHMYGKSNSKKIVSINDKFFRTIINNDGMGSVSFKGSDVIGDESINSVYQLPIYLYNEEDNFTKKIFSDSYLNVLPSSIAMHAIDPRCDPTDTEYYVDPTGSWIQPSECLSDPVDLDLEDISPTIPPNALPSTCREEWVDISNNVCRLFNNSATLLNNGMVVHAYISSDISYSDSSDDRFNINKVFIAKQQTTLDVQVVANRDVVIEPKESGSVFLIHVDDDVWTSLLEVDNISDSDIYVVLFNDTIGFQRIKIIDRVIDEYTGSNVLVGEMEGDLLNINDWLFCVNAVFYHASESPNLYIDTINYNSLPYVRDNDGNYLQVLNASISSNSKYIGENEESYIYIIAEVLNGINSQLFFASLTVGKDDSINRENTEWVQLTHNGNNQYPVTQVGSDNNLHIMWESDRAGARQIYYGVLGLSLISSALPAFSSCIDKYSEFLSRDDTPFDYFSTNLLLPISEDLYSPSQSLPEYDSESLVSSNWSIYSDGENISQSVSDNYINNLTIVANAVSEDAMAFNSLKIVNDEDNPSDYSPFPYSQFNYQISFNLISTVSQESSLAYEYDGLIINDKELDNIFDEWKGEFIPSVNSNVENQTVYSKNSNNFTIGRTDHVFDRIVPFVGSYKHDNQNPSVDRFQINITNQNNNLKDFTFGLIFEKTIFVATNISTSSEFSEDNPSVVSYIESEEHVIYTGMAKLVALIKTEDVEDDRANYIVVREFPEKINVIEDTTYTIIVNYTKLDSEEVTTLLDTYNQTYSNKLLGQITLIINNIPRFSQSFISTITNDYNYFDIGFGIPYGGYYVADKMSPSKLGVFDNVETTLLFTNISISSPTFSHNTEVISLPSNIRDMTKLIVNELNPSVVDYVDLLHMGVNQEEDCFMQVPITFEGINQSPSITLGSCNDIHAVWQSNRDKYWNIFYSNSVNKLSPFRFNTQITNTESNSLRPSVSVNRNGSRLIVWHDNRNGNYDIFTARSVEGYDCDDDKCKKEMAIAFKDEIVECSIYIDYDAKIGIHSLSLEFYKDAASTDLYTIISIDEDTKSRWFIDNSTINNFLSYNVDEIEGVVFSANDSVTVSYIPGKDDGIFDKVLYVKLISTEVGL